MNKSGPWWSVWRVVRVLLLAYAGLVGLLFFTQRGLIYFPDNYSEEEGIRLADRRGLELWEAEGVFHGWKSSGEGDSAILIFHGNAGGGIHRDYLRDLFRDLPVSSEHSVYILEYPGYGFRSGRPSEQAFREAAVEAYQVLQNSYSSILLVGESIGGGVATWLAAEKEAEGLLLITPFNRLAAVAAHHYPWLPARWLLRDHFRNDEHLENFAGPVAFVVAGEDAVIPSSLARKLYESYDGPKLYRLQEGADHNTIYYGPGLSFWEEVMTFVLPASASDESTEF